MRRSRWTGRLVGRPGVGSTTPILCSFCGRPHTRERPIVAGPTPGVAICRDCVRLCAEIMDEAQEDA